VIHKEFEVSERCGSQMQHYELIFRSSFDFRATAVYVWGRGAPGRAIDPSMLLAGSGAPCDKTGSAMVAIAASNQCRFSAKVILQWKFK